MTLDERLRTDLHDAVTPSPLREDAALDAIRLQHRRGLVRRGVARQAIAATVVLSLFASVALVVSWRNTPDQFRSTATLRGAGAGSRELALAPSIRRATLVAAHLAPDDTRIDFRATPGTYRDWLTLEATAPSAKESAGVTREWVSVFIGARRREAVRRLKAQNRALDLRFSRLLDQLETVNAELVRVDPATYAGHDLGFRASVGRPPLPVPEEGSTHELNLANERVQIVAALTDLGTSAGPRITGPTPDLLARPVAQAPAVRVDTASPATVPLLVGWAIGLVIVVLGALFVYRRRTRSLRQVAA